MRRARLIKLAGMGTNELESSASAKNALAVDVHVNRCCLPKESWNQRGGNEYWLSFPFSLRAHRSAASSGLTSRMRRAPRRVAPLTSVALDPVVMRQLHT